MAGSGLEIFFHHIRSRAALHAPPSVAQMSGGEQRLATSDRHVHSYHFLRESRHSYEYNWSNTQIGKHFNLITH